MKKIITLLFFTILFASCATTKTYVGDICYYMPDGTQETYSAAYSAYFDGLTGIEDPVKSSPIVVNYGDGMILKAKDIPYKFVGEEVKKGGDIYTTNKWIDYKYEGKTYEIPIDIWSAIKKLSTSNGILNQKRCEALLSDYIENIVKKEQKYKDGLYQY